MKNILSITIILSSLNSCSDNNENSNKKDKNNITKSNESIPNTIVPKKIIEKVIRPKDTKSEFVVGQWYFCDKKNDSWNPSQVYGRYKNTTEPDQFGTRFVVFDKTLTFNFSSDPSVRDQISDIDRRYHVKSEIDNFLKNPIPDSAIPALIEQIKKNQKKTDEYRSEDGSDEVYDNLIQQ